MNYDRKIKYLELFEGNIRLQNAGFIKLEARDGVVSLIIKVEKLKDSDEGPAKIVLIGNGREAVLGEIFVEKGRGSRSYEKLSEKKVVDGIAYDELEEVQIMLRNNRMLRGIVTEKRKEKQLEPLSPEPLMVMQEEKEVEAVSIEHLQEETGIRLDSKEEECEETIVSQKQEKTEIFGVNSAPATTKWQQLWESYPHITPFDDHREYIELKPKDLVVLTRECYPLVSNSFLLHGFYNYHHLILTKESAHGQEQYYVGAPGNFYAKEKQVAILFGFESFEGKTEPAQNGDFGYYMIPVEI